jgi:hypothetical protein
LDPGFDAKLAIDAVFGGEGSAGAGESELAPELSDLRALRVACRAALTGTESGPGESQTAEADAAERASEALRVARVTRRILTRTTRENLGRKGDVGLLIDFATERLRDSAVLRVAVALLIVQCTIVPLVAWHMLRTPELTGFPLNYEPQVEDDTDRAPVEESLDEVVGGTDWAALDDVLSRHDRAEDVTRGRALLGTAVRLASERAGVDPSTDLGRALLGLGAGTASVPPGPGALEFLPVNLAGAVIATELRLQRFSDTGEWRGLPEALDALAEHVRTAGATARGLELAGRAFAHARLLGVAIPSLPETVTSHLEGGSSGTDGPQRLWTDPQGWLNALASEIQAAEHSDPFVRAWIDVVREL